MAEDKKDQMEEIMHKLQCMSGVPLDDNKLAKPTEDELRQFRKSKFYHNWYWRFHQLGLIGTIDIPNTTFEEWLIWFQRWAELFTEDYNQFKQLVFEALQNVEAPKLTTGTPNFLKINGYNIDYINHPLTTKTPKFLKVDGNNIDFNDSFSENLKRLMVWKHASPLDFKYLEMQDPATGATTMWQTAYHPEDFQIVRQGRVVNISAYVKTVKIFPSLKEYNFMNVTQNYFMPQAQTFYSGTWSNVTVTGDVSVHGYISDNGTLQVTTGPYNEAWNNGYLEFGFSYLGVDYIDPSLD